MSEPQKTRTAYTRDDQGIMNNWAIEPKMYVDQGEDRFGMTEYAELVNGRLAMVGMVGLVILELTTGKGILGILGIH